MIVTLQLLRDAKPILLRKVIEQRFRIGSHEDNEFCLADSDIPAFLCEIEHKGPKYTLKNLHPDGIRVNDEIIEESTRLAHKDVLRLGSFELQVLVSKEEGKLGQVKTKSLFELDDGASALSVHVVGRSLAERWSIDSQGIVFGTQDTCDIIIDDPYVSGLHGRFYRQDNKFFVEDLQSRNGLRVDEHRVVHAEVKSGARIALGNTQLELVGCQWSVPDTAEASSDIVPLIGATQCMRELRHMVQKVAAVDVPVLISGETGTGKEVVAQQIYNHSKRYEKPFIALNCSTLNPQLIASELFGHRKGAFTGADESKAGAFEVADGGTLFLDEIGELPLGLQAQLLRVLESGELRPVGATMSKRVDVRLMAATNRDLSKEVAKGRFREDLYHRLNVVELSCPPLRKRLGDLPLLVDYLLKQLCCGDALSVNKDFLRGLAQRQWPGNIRELRNFLQQAIIFAEGSELSEADLSGYHSLQEKKQSVVKQYTLAELEKNAILSELIARSGNKKETAAALGVSRSTIHRKIEEYQIDLDAEALRHEEGVDPEFTFERH